MFIVVVIVVVVIIVVGYIICKSVVELLFGLCGMLDWIVFSFDFI